ncbi:hypothetical protein D3C85_1054860 [compost metagenome]
MWSLSPSLESRECSSDRRPQQGQNPLASGRGAVTGRCPTSTYGQSRSSEPLPRPYPQLRHQHQLQRLNHPRRRSDRRSTSNTRSAKPAVSNTAKRKSCSAFWTKNPPDITYWETMVSGMAACISAKQAHRNVSGNSPCVVSPMARSWPIV